LSGIKCQKLASGDYEINFSKKIVGAELILDGKTVHSLFEKIYDLKDSLAAFLVPYHWSWNSRYDCCTSSIPSAFTSIYMMFEPVSVNFCPLAQLGLNGLECSHSVALRAARFVLFRMDIHGSCRWYGNS
jgi:hypothetical protein